VGGEIVTAQLLTNCSNTLCNTHTKARENIIRTRAKRKAGYFFVAHPVCSLQHWYHDYSGYQIKKIRWLRSTRRLFYENW